MGAMSITADGVLQWALPDGNMVALQQFRDNVMVAAKGPAPNLAMYPVCQALEGAWNLHVLCPCCGLLLVLHGHVGPVHGGHSIRVH